ncbi:MAG: polysaccharide biosynthesis tyrosine autokinase [Actinobacteria bacterium]|nr:polysaccharide biosynthesis tyrosine autokinase [Actinomycetota bacterium]
MTLHDYLRVLREQWIVVMIATALGVGGAAGVYFFRSPEYTAKLTMYVSTQGADTTQAAFQGAQLSQDRVASYTELLTSSRVTTDVIAKLGLPETTDELAKKMTATSKLDSVLIDVTVTDPDPRRATEILNAVGQVFPDLVNELERPTIPDATSAVAVRVVQPAQLPDNPSSTGLSVTLTMGLLAGLAIGLCGALIRSAVDVSVKAPEQLRDAVGVANLGTIAFDSHVPSRPLIVHEKPQSPRSEAFRQLRTNLQFVDVDNPRKVIIVTSSMPGEGKTTTIVNLAITLASAGARVLLIEADLRRPKVADLLGLERTIGLTNVLSGRMHAAQVIQPWGEGALDVIASGPLPPNPSELLSSRHMGELLSELRNQYDVVLIDSPPLLPVTDAAAIAPVTDGAILVCRFKKTTCAQVAAAAAAVSAVSASLLGTVFTMVPSSGPRAYAQYNSYYRAEQPEAPTNLDGPTASGDMHGRLSALHGVPISRVRPNPMVRDY